MQLPSRIRTWLNNRGIIDEVIADNHITWNGQAIVIPIYDENGNFAYNKYRRDPAIEAGPKYWFDQESRTMLYNWHLVKNEKRIFIVEGEMDAMLLRSKGYNAISSTSGASTFKQDWVHLFKDKEVYVCYDNDDAGKRGAQKVIELLGQARLIVLPDTVGDHGDLTDFFNTLGASIDDFNMLLIASVPFSLFNQIVNPDDKQAVRLAKRELMKDYDKIRIAEKQVVALYNSNVRRWALDELREFTDKKINACKRVLYARKAYHDGGKVEAAKSVPIETLYQGELDQNGNRLIGLCPFHNEKTGSFTVFTNNNSWYCFGCSSGGDSIAYVMKRDDCDFKQALDRLLNV